LKVRTITVLTLILLSSSNSYVYAVTCGDGTFESPEACDDSNTRNGDG